MKIHRFAAKGIHGYLSPEVDFHPELTFLTGINGSGKTSVVTSLFALVSPQLDRLVELEFESMELLVTDEDRTLDITAHRTEEAVILQCPSVGEPLEIPLIAQDEDFDFRDPMESRKFYQDFEARNASNPTLRSIKSLPTPMFLGIDRRQWEDASDRTLIRRRAIQRQHHGRNVFGSSLAASLIDAAFLARDSYGSVQAQQRGLADDLRRDLILGALQYDDPSYAEAPSPISDEDLRRIRYTLLELGIEEDELGERVEGFARRLNKIVRSLPPDAQFTRDPSGWPVDATSEEMDAFFQWVVNKPQFDRLRRIMEDVRGYVSRVQQINKPLDRYREVVNNFLQDSGKTIQFDAVGNLRVAIDDHTRPVAALSSGERQLVVILSHLAFNPAGTRANVFIIDEPELSLHLRWQELFVDAVRSVNPRVQAVLATHSPSIILDRTDNCVDLSWTVA